MKSVVIGTAGHIDHGKTTLVKALTGIDADRLEEEKRRGITIDLGFANLELTAANGENLRLGFVDVPGHERFVRNMLAGVGGIDIVLLVIAADEGIKPQTREHFDICSLLSIRRGIVALTKADAVDAETLELARLEVDEFLRGSFLDPQRTPIVPVSAVRGDGIEQLKLELARAALEVTARDSMALPRLPVDRAFIMKGFGTVVTGTLISGAIRREQELEVHPSGRHVRTRGVQVHGRATEQAKAGERTAINLAGVDTDELARGMMLTQPGALHPSRQIDVRLHLLKSAKPLKDLARVHLHHFAAETVAQVRLLEGKQLEPGGSMLAQLRPEEPLVPVPGDRFIIRQFSPVITIGGGMVIDAFPLKRTAAQSANAREFLHKLEDVRNNDERLNLRIERRGIDGLNVTNAIKEMGLRRSDIDSALQNLARAGRVVIAGDVALAKAAVESAAKRLLDDVAAFHKNNPLVGGISKESLREREDLDPEVFGYLLQQLSNGKKIEVAGEQVRLAGSGVSLNPEEERARRTIEQAFSSAGLRVPLLKDVLASLPIDRTRSQKIMTLLLREGALVKLSDDLVFHRRALESLRQTVVSQKTKSSQIDVAHFKDLTGLSRKYAIPLLEYLDRERVTRRVGESREIL
ncbi:MAG TPA: selenocysteine-specific translation elongation factor [Terriglobales bacterium]|nr:selenocysteine-specific translation elongation factor [Terriglobales bacterium]